MSINQINDDGAVIGYQPKLYYDKNRTQKIDSIKKDDNKLNNTERHSITFADFYNNTPSKMLSTLDFSINNMNKLIDKLSKSFDDTSNHKSIKSLLSAIETSNDNYIKQFVDDYREDINGSVIPELIETIYKTKQRLETLQTTMKYLYYGDENISQKECSDIDKTYLEKIKAYENIGQLEKVNYVTMSFDSILNRSICNYALNANKECIKIANIINKTDDKVSSNSNSTFVEKMHNEIVSDINNRTSNYELHQNVAILQKTLYNYYYKRQELLDLYDLIGDSESTYLIRKLKSYRIDFEDSIKEINKTFIGNQKYLSELETMESERYFLLNIYKGISNNS